MQAELTKRPSVALAALLHRLVPLAFPERYGYDSDAAYLELNGTCTHDKLLGVADDMPTSVAWAAVDAQRQHWVATLPARRTDLLSWLTGQDPGTTLMELLAFCTASLIDGISGTEKPHAVNAVSQALQLDMTRYWTPTRASYLDHVSKARIIDVVANAISPKAAVDLRRMKKGDAAAAAELRLAKVKWVPEILTDQTLPVINHFDPDDDDEEDDDGDIGDGSPENGDAGESADGMNGAKPDGQGIDRADGVNGKVTAEGTEDDAVSPATPDKAGNGTLPAWPFPTAPAGSGRSDTHGTA